MTWLAAEAAIVNRLREKAIDAHALVSRAALSEVAAGASEERWRGVAVTYGGYGVEPHHGGCAARVTQRWSTWCVLWDAGASRARLSADADTLVDSVLGALLGFEPMAGQPLMLVAGPAADDDAAALMLPLNWTLDMYYTRED